MIARSDDEYGKRQSEIFSHGADRSCGWIIAMGFFISIKERFMDWLILVIAGIFETGWAIGLKYTEGFTRLWPTVWTILAMIVSLWLLGISMKSLPVGTAYSIWVGIGAVGTVILGIVLLGESANAGRIISIAFIIAGIIGLKLTSST